MTRRLRSLGEVLLVWLACALSAQGANEPAPPDYFDLGPRLIQEFRGTYIFKHKRLEFIRGSSDYVIKSSGDQSPREDRLVTERGFTSWILSPSEDKWRVFKNPLRRGDEWSVKFGGWNQRYRVTHTGITVDVPAGKFQQCAKVEISWVANEPDMRGPQKIVVYLAPGLGIIKEEHYSSGDRWHEEELTYVSRGK